MLVAANMAIERGGGLQFGSGPGSIHLPRHSNGPPSATTGH